MSRADPPRPSSPGTDGGFSSPSPDLFPNTPRPPTDTFPTLSLFLIRPVLAAFSRAVFRTDGTDLIPTAPHRHKSNARDTFFRAWGGISTPRPTFHRPTLHRLTHRPRVSTLPNHYTPPHLCHNRTLAAPPSDIDISAPGTTKECGHHDRIYRITPATISVTGVIFLKRGG